MNNSVVITQARLSSTRLPGKVLKSFFKESSILDLQLKKLRSLGLPYLLATTKNALDDSLVEWAKNNKVPYFRGEEHDVLNRFISAAESIKAKNIIRVCSDNPFIQLDHIEAFLQYLDKGVDYVSFSDSIGIPAILKHWGLFVEAVSLNSLKAADRILDSSDNFYREHVTNFIYSNPDKFRVKLLPANSKIRNRDDLRFTIDTQVDFNNMQRLSQLLNMDKFSSLEELIDLVDSEEEILREMRKGIEKFDK